MRDSDRLEGDVGGLVLQGMGEPLGPCSLVRNRQRLVRLREPGVGPGMLDPYSQAKQATLKF